MSRRAQQRLEGLEATFASELGDRVTSLNALLLQLERGDDRKSALGELRRELHSLKGGARAVGATEIARLLHAAEGALLALHGQADRVTPALCEALLATVDALEPLHSGTRAEAAELIARLQGLPMAGARASDVPAPVVEQPREVAQPKDVAQPTAVEDARPVDEPKPRTKQVEELKLTPTAPAAPTRREEAGSVRVAVAKLDTLLSESGELSVTHQRVAQRLGQLRELHRDLEHLHRGWRRSRFSRARLRRGDAATHGSKELESLLRLAEQADQHLQRLLHETGSLVSGLSQTTSQLGTVAGVISQEVMAIRLLPAGTVFLPLERLVRDLSRQTGKDTRLALDGTETEIDRRILDDLRDPLMHMVRNTIDHGIELPEDRAALGKPRQGTLRLSAAQRGNRVQISVEDDGRGLDVDAIRATAVRRGLLSAERAESMEASAAIDLIFHPGFSTRTTVSEISGRGVGMDVVRAQVEKLGGEINVRTTPGVGTCFTMTVPLTLATTRVLLVEDAEHTFAVPSASIERTGRVRAGDLMRLEGRRALNIDGRAVPVVELADLLDRPRPANEEEWRPYFVLQSADRAVAVLTDRLVDEQELVIKALGAPLRRVRNVGGAAVLGTGAVVVILNPADLTKTALGRLDTGQVSVRSLELPSQHAEAVRRRVLVVDDSVMTRTLERSILEAAGYEVVVASDGLQAIELLHSTAVDLIVSDVEMPRMTGLELTAAVRQDEQLRHLPVVLVTSLDTPEHVERGAAAGADAYIVKGRFDQNDLLLTVGRLL